MRPVVDAIVTRVQPRVSKGHADLASSPPSSPTVEHQHFVDALLWGQSRLTLITGNRGCVRYLTEENSSNHELTTAMQHLSSRLATIHVSADLRLDF